MQIYDGKNVLVFMFTYNIFNMLYAQKRLKSYLQTFAAKIAIAVYFKFL